MKYKFLCLSLLFLSCSSDDGNTPTETTIDAVVNIISVSQITENSAIVSAEVVSSSDNITERGIVWSNSGTPTVDDNTISSGSGLGEFQVTIQGLDAETNFQIRAYARSASGIGYSGIDNFQTQFSCGTNVFNGEETVVLETQADVENFGANGYCEINANLVIGTIFNDDDKITNISSLSTIRKVKGLTIHNTLLFELDDLSNLNYAEYLTLYQNDNLENLDGLSNINSAFKRFRIEDNPNLRNINGLSQVTASEFPTDPLLVSLNPLLVNLDGFLGLTQWKEDISIVANESLTNLDGLNNIGEHADFDLRIELNNSLQNIDGLSNITSTGFVTINENPLLVNLDGLSGLDSDIYFFQVESNINLIDFCALQSTFSNHTVFDYFVNNNAYNPTLQDIVDGNCSQ